MKQIKTWIGNKKLWLIGLAILFVPPIVIQMLFSPKCCGKAYIGLSASDVLSYTGIILGVFGSILIALITFVYERERKQQEEEQKEIDRRNKIQPSLALHLTQNEDVYTLAIFNHKEAPALSVHIEDQFLFSAIHHNEKKEIDVVFDSENDSDALYLYSFKNRLDQEGIPSKVTLYYMDIDKNTLEEEFTLSDGGEYLSNTPFYL